LDWMEYYAEYGAVGVFIGLFVYGYFRQNKRADAKADADNKRAEEQAAALSDLQIENKGQSENIENIESILLKLLDRWNKSDAEADRRYEKTIENAERRQEKTTFELRTHSEALNYLKGKLDQK